VYSIIVAEAEEAATIFARLFARLPAVRQVCMAWLPYDLADDPLPKGQICRLYLAVSVERAKTYRKTCGQPKLKLVDEAMDIFGGDELYAVRVMAALQHLRLDAMAFLAEVGEAAHQLTELQHIDIVLVAGNWRSTPWPYTMVEYANQGSLRGVKVFGKDWGAYSGDALCFAPQLDSFLPVIT